MLSLHRTLKQHVLQLIDETGEGNLQALFFRAFVMVRKAWPEGHELQAPIPDKWRDCELCLPHVLSLVSVFQLWAPKIEGNEHWVNLIADTVLYMWERGLGTDCIRLMEIGEEICSNLSHIDEIATIHANICCVQAGVQQDLGSSGRAISLQKCEKALELRQKCVRNLEQKSKLGMTDVLRLANAWNDVGVAMIHDEHFEGSKHYFEESLRLKRQWTTEDALPWHFGETYKNLAFVVLSQGQVSEAQAYARRASELCSRGMEEKSAARQKARFIEATILLNSNEQEKAFKIHKQVLQARIEIFGEGNPFTKDSMYTVGEIYRLKGKMDKAE